MYDNYIVRKFLSFIILWILIELVGILSEESRKKSKAISVQHAL